MTDAAIQQEYCLLLYSLKTTVEGLLVNQVTNVWNIYGGLTRLFTAVEKIFKHGCKIFDRKGDPNISLFIEGLTWIQPSESVFQGSCNDLAYSHLPQSLQNDQSLFWIYKSLESHSLSRKLFWLTSNTEHLLSCYENLAFLCQDKYVKAVITCLAAVEQNQLSLVTEIHPSLYITNWNFTNFSKTHRRCSSLPEQKKRNIPGNLQHCGELELPSYATSRKLSHEETQQVVTGLGTVLGNVPAQDTSKNTATTDEDVKTRSSSLPSINLTEAQTTSPEENLLKVEYKLQEKRSKRMREKSQGAVKRTNFTEIKTIPEYVTWKGNDSDDSCTDTVDSRRRRRSKEYSSWSSVPVTAGEWFGMGVVPGKKVSRKKTFMEDGGTSVLPMSTGYFPRPARGQSLTSFLSSSQFSRTNAELDRENAHFSISEAMIAAIEQVKCNRQLKLVEESREESDEEINTLKQRIRLRRRQKHEERQKITLGISLLSDGKTDTTTTDQSFSPLSSSPDTCSNSVSTDDVEDLEMDQASNLQYLQNTSLSMSMASLYSEADLSKHGSAVQKATDVTNTTESTISAENVALSLLRQFKEKQLPRASDLEWLVSEEDAPQELLPMPKSWPVSPDEAEDTDMTQATPLRGTTEWAPPRAQVIFTPHPAPVRRTLMVKQNFRCSGCGLKVATEYAHRFRYCEYLGRYFCTNCHSNKLALIPGKILMKWNFTRYPVSTFAYQLIDQMSTDPLFQLVDLNPSLYKKVKLLEKTRVLRLQLCYLKDFLMMCRFADQLQEELLKEPSYMLTDPDVYSLSDLVNVKNSELPSRLRILVAEACTHVVSCDLCQARGFVCELCHSNDIIFPWQITKVVRCSKCGTCFHTSCLKTGFCPRCLRFEARRKSQETVDNR